MNIYIVIEDDIGAVNVYKKWIKYLNPELEYKDKLEDIVNNNFYIISGRGYPNIKRVIENSIEEINENKRIDRFVVAIDSEDLTYDEKKDEFSKYIQQFDCIAKYYLIIQHFCLETWALGNRKLRTNNPKNEKLKEFINFYDVVNMDPELLPAYPKLELNRVQYAFRYLVTILNDKYKNVSYSKHNTRVIQNKYFFDEVKNRLETTSHIKSFKDFVEAFT